MSAEQWPIRRLLEWTEQFLREKQIENPRLEAQILLSHVVGCKRIDLYVRSEELPSDEKRSAFRALIKRRVDGCPVAYLVDQREFYQLVFEVGPAVLIPRPETEILVMEALRRLKGKDSPRVLDIGTGSGAIALSIAHQYKTAQVTATDISPDALAVARKNVEKHGLEKRVRLLAGDLFEPIKNETFDLIASNPPYVAASEFSELAKDVRDFEPRLALDGGPDGLAIYRRLIAEAAAHLNPGGYLFLEIGAKQDKSVRELVDAVGQFESTKLHLDGQKLPRAIEARKKQ